MVQVNPDSRVLQGLTTFLEFVALNIAYLVTCVPVITIPAATSALFRVTIRYSDDELGRPLRDFFPAFASQFLRATAVGFGFLLPAVALAFSGVFWFATGTVVGAVAAALALLAAAYAFAGFLVGMALVAQYRDGIGRTIRNALLIPAAEPVRTAGVVIVPVTIAALCVVLPPVVVLLATIACSAGAYLAAFLFRSIFARRTA